MLYDCMKDAYFKTRYTPAIMFILVILVQGISLNKSYPRKLFQCFDEDTANELSSAICHDSHSDLIKSSNHCTQL